MSWPDQHYAPIIKMAQYLARLTAQQDFWSEAEKALLTFMGADLVVFVEKGAGGEIIEHHMNLSNDQPGESSPGLPVAFRNALSSRSPAGLEIHEAINETFESAFLTSRFFSIPEPLSLALYPINLENKVAAVMLVGYATSEPFSKEQLNVYLAVAGLVESTATRLVSEKELRRHRQHLEELVIERTAKLTETNEQLQQEIIQRKQAEEELQQAHLRLTTVVNSMDALIYIIDMDTYEILFVNEYGRRVWGDIAGQTCWKVIQRGQNGPCQFCTNDKLLDKDGRPTGVFAWELQNSLNGRWYDCRDIAVRWFDGRLVRLEIATDITESKQAEEALNESEQRFRYIAEFSPLPLAIVSENGNYEYLNPKFIEVFGYTLADIPTGKKWFELAYPDLLYRQQVIQSWKKYREEIVKYVATPTTFTATCKNGIKKETLFRTVLMDNGKLLVIYEDITDRKQAEQKLADYTLELEQKRLELEGLYQQLDQQLDKARSIHERTLPKKFPHIEGLSLSTYYQPAQRMGGDFYNAIQVDNKLVFYISDVSGHGLEGALLSVFVKEAIDSYATLKPEAIEPGRILRHLDRQYRRENYPADYFICIFVMVLDLKTMELTYTGAGFQELPLVQMGNGERMRLNSEGPPISNVIPEEIMNYTEGKVRLTPGTTVLVSTDGITEQQTGEEQYNDRLEQVFYEHSHLPPEIIMSAIKEDFYHFNGSSMQGDDDITLGIIQLEPEGTRKMNLELESNIDALSSL